MERTAEISQDELKRILDYDCATGDFKWLVKRPNTCIGNVAGYITKNGYKIIGINNRSFVAHKLAWLYMYGYMPKSKVYFSNHDTLDTRIKNLSLSSELEISQETLKKFLNYNPITGNFVNIRKRIGLHKECIGEVAGFSDKDGYLCISLLGKLYKLHRLSFLYMDGYMPESAVSVDHINRDTSDNRWCNLRVAARYVNAINRGIPGNNTSGVTGVVFDSSRNKYAARIGVKNKHINLGRFDNFIDAVAARYKGEIKYGFNLICNESSAYSYLKDNNYITSEWERG